MEFSGRVAQLVWHQVLFPALEGVGICLKVTMVLSSIANNSLKHRASGFPDRHLGDPLKEVSLI